MEAGIRMLYNGKQFSSIEKVKAPDEKELVTVGMAQDVALALEPLRAAIEKEGGEVTVNLKGPSMFEISTMNLSDNLKVKVLKALRPSD